MQQTKKQKQKMHQHLLSMLDITSLGNQIETDKSNITLKQTKSHDAFFY